jgi:hypothetical protein
VASYRNIKLPSGETVKEPKSVENRKEYA